MTAEPAPLRLVTKAEDEDTPFARPVTAALVLLGAKSGALVQRDAGGRATTTPIALSPEEVTACRNLARRLWTAPPQQRALSSSLGGASISALRLEPAENEAALVVVGPAAEALDPRSSRVRAALALLGAVLEVAGQSAASEAAAHAAHERLERLRALNRVVEALARSADLEAGCAALLSELRRQLGGIDIAAVWVPEREGRGLRTLAADGDWGVDEPVRRLAYSEGKQIAAVLERGEPRESQPATSGRGRSGSSALARRLGLVSVLHMPLGGFRAVAGVLTLGARSQRTFDEDERRFLVTLCAQLGAQIDAQRQLERAAAERERLQMLLATMPAGIAIFSPDGKPTLHNRAIEEIWGHGAIEASPDTFNEVYGLRLPDGRPLPASESPLARALDGRGGPDAGQELLVRRPDRLGDVPVLVHAAAVADGGSRANSVITVYQDITALREVDRLKDTFINTISHELRTPITTVRGGAMTLLRLGESLDAPNRRQMLLDIAEEAERLYHLVEDLLWMTRAQAGVRLPTEPIIAHRFVNKVITDMGGQIGKHALMVDVPAELPLLDAVPTCLEQVLRNLLENAVKFSPRGRKIEIKARVEPERPDELTFSVLDRGSGIPPQDMDRVFEPFYRTQEAVKSQSQGAGLGLAVCRRLIEVQGGSIWAEPRPGGGTAFRFTLPALPELED